MDLAIHFANLYGYILTDRGKIALAIREGKIRKKQFNARKAV